MAWATKSSNHGRLIRSPADSVSLSSPQFVHARSAVTPYSFKSQQAGATFMKHPTIRQTVTTSLGVAALLIWTGTAIADKNEDRPDRPEEREPPQAAFEACAASVEGDSCTVETDRGDTISGACAAPPHVEALVCVPEGGRRGQHRGPGKRQD